MKSIEKMVTCVLAGLLAAAFVGITPSTSHADKPSPYLKPDESWISISGTAVDTEAEGFTLDYGKGIVYVEMDDWDWYDEGYAIFDGDSVTVYGRVDDDLFETTTIEASSVYVQNVGTYFYANAADEEDDYPVYDYWFTYGPVVVGQTTARGTVTDVTGREFTIDTGLREIRVDTALMPYNPLDDLGYQQVDVGDYVSVSGDMDYDFWESRELMADSVVTLMPDS